MAFEFPAKILVENNRGYFPPVFCIWKFNRKVYLQVGRETDLQFSRGWF